jgi:hypothetical protein
MSSPGWGLSGWGDPLVVLGNLGERFDRLLTGLCSIYRKAGSNLNAYGIPDQTPTLIEENVACRLSTISAGKEFYDPKQDAVRNFELFMRPRTYALAETNFINFEGRWFEITSVLQVRNRDHSIHHLQVYLQETMPST